jgi:hypothetical protein
VEIKGVVALGCAVAVLFGASAAVVLASGTHSVDATRCSPSVARTNKRIAPGLRMVRVSAAKGTCKQSWIAVVGGTGRDIWGFNYDGGLWHSTDDLQHWNRVWQGPPGSFVERVLRTASGHVLIEVGFGSRSHRIMRSTTKSARRFTTSLVLPPRSSLHFATSWGQYSAVGAKPRTIYVGEYGDRPNPVHLWASTDDGRSFTSVFSLPGRSTTSSERVRHFHGVFLDPYTKTLWVAIGDNTPEPRIGFSSDGGRSFTWITRGTYPQSRAVGLMFTKDAVYWGTDVPELPGGLYRWDRSGGAITKVSGNLDEPYFDARQSRGWSVQFSEISTKLDDGYIGDEHVHVLVGTGSHWYYVTTPWVRNAALTDAKVAPLGMTQPDATGCFWFSLPNLAGSAPVRNIKVCLGR